MSNTNAINPQQTFHNAYSLAESNINKILRLFQNIYCFNMEISVPDLPNYLYYLSNPKVKLCWRKISFPLVIIIILFIQYGLNNIPDNNVYKEYYKLHYFNNIIIIFYIFYLLIRFIVITDETKTITLCDKLFIISFVIILYLRYQWEFYS